MNEEHNVTTPTPNLDNLCKKESLVGISSRISYYYNHNLDDGVPFKWEIKPGTPINLPSEEVVSPFTPPPAYPSPRISFVGPFQASKRYLSRWKNLRKRYLSRWSSQIMSRKDNSNARDVDSKSSGELERSEKSSEDYRSSSSSSSSSSSFKDWRLIKASPRQWVTSCLQNIKNSPTSFR